MGVDGLKLRAKNLGVALLKFILNDISNLGKCPPN